MFGDSHTEVFDYISVNGLIPRSIFYTTFVGGATAQGMRNPNSQTNSLLIFREKISELNINDKLIFQLGEVDTGFVIWYRASKYGESIEDQLLNSVNCYFEFINEVKNNGFKHILIVSAPLPTIQDNQEWGEIASARKEVKATLKERTELTIKYNELLREYCLLNKVSFLGTDELLLDKTSNKIHKKFMNKDRDNHHLDLNNYSKIIKNCFRDDF